MNDQTPQEKKRALPLPLMILGFIGIIVLMAWISIKIVNLAPSAFSSLASLAESLNERREQAALDANTTKKITITSNVSLANTDETVTLSWGEASVPGTFTFAYECREGVTIDLIDTDGVRSIDCATNYNIGTATNLNLSISSTKDRYADVTYTVAFLGTNDTTPRASGNNKLTVLNTEATGSIVATEESTTSEEAASTVETPTISPEPAQPTEPTPTTPSTPTYTEEYVYTVPVSNPNGRTDLGIAYLGTGTIVGKTFFAGKIEKNESGAIQFEVRNYGTKTSGNWTFSAALPDGTTYTSDSQLPLKPNERALLTVGFATTNTTSHTFVVTTQDANDQTTINNTLRKTVTFY